MRSAGAVAQGLTDHLHGPIRGLTDAASIAETADFLVACCYYPISASIAPLDIMFAQARMMHI